VGGGERGPAADLVPVAKSALVVWKPQR